ncbi:hypothetical protein Tco_0957438 [Tanacetum coccineum]
MPYISTSDGELDSRVQRVIDNHNIQGKSGFIQFWECCASGDSEDNGRCLLLTDHLEKNVGNWFAGRAAQTQVADYQYSSEELAQHNEIYAAYFNQIQAALMEVNLTSTYLGKTIKVEYNQQLVKFTLPFPAELPDLTEQVTMRFKELENKAFSIAYKDTNYIRHSILSDNDLHFCIAGSILNRTTLIRMVVEDVVG